MGKIAVSQLCGNHTDRNIGIPQQVFCGIHFDPEYIILYIFAGFFLKQF